MHGRPDVDARWPYGLGLSVLSIVTAAFILALVILSPFALRAIANREDDWQTLSAVGQAYGAVSAVLSALALCGIALSLLLQWRQVRIAQIITARERQFELIQLGLTNPELIYARIDGISDDVLPHAQYANLWVAHWKLLWDLKLVREPEVAHLAAELFTDDTARLWWEKVGPHWNISGSRRSNRFVKIMMESHQRVTEARASAGAPPPGPTPESQGIRLPSQRSRNADQSTTGRDAD
jgi:hypothetical protein